MYTYTRYQLYFKLMFSVLVKAWVCLGFCLFERELILRTAAYFLTSTVRIIDREILVVSMHSALIFFIKKLQTHPWIPRIKKQNQKPNSKIQKSCFPLVCTVLVHFTRLTLERRKILFII